MDYRPDLKCKYLGLHSCRYQATYVSSPYIYHTIGNHIVKRQIENFEKLNEFQAHNSLISAFVVFPRQDPTSVISADYYGNIAWHSLEGELISYYKISQKSLAPKGIRYASSNHDSTLLALLSLGGNPYNGTIDIYSIENQRIVPIKQLRGGFKQCEFINCSDLFVLRENTVDPGELGLVRQRDKPIAIEKALENFESETDEYEDSESLLKSRALSGKKTITYYACAFFDVKNSDKGRAEAVEIFSRVNTIKQNYQGIVAFVTINRNLYVMDMASLKILHHLSLKGSGSLSMTIFDDNFLYFSPSAKYFCRFDTSQSSVAKVIDMENPCPEIKVIKTDKQWIHKNNFLAWVEREKKLISLNEYGIFLGEFLDFDNSSDVRDCRHEVIFQMTCCGLEIHPSLPIVAVGDFAGGVFLYDYYTGEIILQASVFGSIRSLSWNESVLYMGTVEGMLFLWDFTSGAFPELVSDLGATVVCMARYGKRLAVGCTSGELWLFGDDGQCTKMLAHEKQDSNDEKFGSLGLFSEIWSLAWSPCGSFLATGSEDQSIRIWDADTYELKHTFEKHKRAVTGVRWEKITELTIKEESINEILVSCSDDETMRIYNGRTWQLLHIFCTSVLQEWHTITYTSIQKNGYYVACVTQNGFIFVVDLRNLSFRFIERIHNGSIEGLDWKEKIVTCSSEGIACVIDVE